MLESAQQVAIGGGLLEKFLLGSSGHALFEAFDQVVAAALDEQSRIARCLRVALVAGQACYAGTLAALDVILQARARVIAVQVNGATGHQEPLMNEMQDASGQAGREIWSKIERAIFLDAASEIHSRIFLRRGELDVRIGLIIAQENIEFRLIALDKIVFERKRLALIVDDDSFQVGDLANQRTGLGVHPARL